MRNSAKKPALRSILIAIPLALLVAACGDDGEQAADAGADAQASTDAPSSDAAQPDAPPPDAAAPDAPPSADAGLPDAAPTICGELGSATANGTVVGETLDPAGAWYRQLVPGYDYYGVVIEEAGSVCNTQPVSQHLVLALLHPWNPGTYEIVLPGDEPKEWGRAYAILESETGHDIATAIGGNLEVDEVAGCVVGTFNAEFPNGEWMYGTFSAVTCD